MLAAKFPVYVTGKSFEINLQKSIDLSEVQYGLILEQVQSVYGLSISSLEFIVKNQEAPTFAVPSAASSVQLTFVHLPAKKVKITQYRIDSQHSNSYEVWKKMGSPTNPTSEQIKELEKAGQLAQYGSPENKTVRDGQLIFSTTLPRQGVGLVTLEW